MSALRALPVELDTPSSSAQITYRASRQAARALGAEETAEASTTRPASRRALDEGAHSRRSLRAIAAPATYTAVRTRSTAPSAPKSRKRRVVALAAPLSIAAVFGAAALINPSTSMAAVTQLPATSLSALAGDVDDFAGYVAEDPDADTVGSVTSAADSPLFTLATDAGGSVAAAGTQASDALATDAEVKAAAEAAAKAAEEAAAKAAAEAAAKAAAKAAASKSSSKSSTSSTSRAESSASAGDSSTQSYKPSVKPGQFIYPVSGTVTSTFGWRIHPVYHTRKFHTGLDIAAACGTPIHASAAGVVTSAGYAGSLGNYVEIDHGNGITTGYGHQSKIAVKVGQTVTQGQVIGYVGSTGTSTGCHVHFNAIHNGAVFNPTALVK